MLKAELKKTQKRHEITSSRDQLKLELERLQRRQQEVGIGKEGKSRMQIEPLMARSRLESKMEVDEVPRECGRFTLDRVAQEKNERQSRDVDPSKTHSVLEQRKPLIVDVTLPDLTPS